MKTIIHYCFEPSDPPIGFVGEAIKRLASEIAYSTEAKSFEKGPDGAGLKAFQRVTGTEGFSEQDLRELCAFMKRLSDRAILRYRDIQADDAPWKDYVLASAVYANTASDQLLALFASLAPNLRPIAEPVAEPAQKPVEPAAQPPTTATPNPTEKTP